MKRVQFGKWIVSALLAVTMIYTTMPVVYAENRAEELPEAEPMPEPEKVDSETEYEEFYTLVPKGEISEYGYQEMVWIDEAGKELEGESTYGTSIQGVPRTVDYSFPSSYQILAEELPAIRNQGKWGTCGSHAAISSIETNMIKKGLVSPLSVDYAERHLAYFSNRRNELTGDGTDRYNDTFGWYGGVGYYGAVSTLSNWYGAAAEADYPYSPYGDMEDLEEGDRNSSICHLTEANILGTPEDVKRAVMETGAVMCSIYIDAEERSGNLYHAESQSINHAVNIIGWDDDYPRENFNDNGRVPASNGAWRCRNSWGKDWAENGYFWISYEDATLGDYCSFEGENSDNYGHIYQYNGTTANSLLRCFKTANVFTAESVENLRAVSFYAHQNYDYTIEIYVEGNKAMENPGDGLLVHKQKGSVEYPGYHTISLERDILLSPGMKYAVSVELKGKDGTDGYAYLEFGDDFSSDPGQSFIHSKERWIDTKEYGNPKEYHNVYIKAFTDDAGYADISCLLPLIEEAGTLEEAAYTPKTWQRFQAAYERAAEIYNSSAPEDSVIIKAMWELEYAEKNLVVSEVFIGNADELEAFAEAALSGNDYDEQTVCLLNDIDMNGISHRAIGSLANPFMGTFDGNGHVITGLTCAQDSNYSGLFGCIGESGSVKNVNLVYGELTLTAFYSGCIAGHNKGNVSGCSAEGNICLKPEREGSGRMGGLVGKNEGTVEQSSIKGTVTFLNLPSITNFVGGVAGYNYGTISKCSARGKIISDGAVSTGGIVGYSEEGSVVELCYNLATITGSPGENTRTAGIGVCLYGRTYGCYNYGKIGRYAGKEFGAVYGYIGKGNLSNCYYVNTSSAKGGYFPGSAAIEMTENEFASGKTAYYLNSNGGASKNTYVWSQKEKLPIWADSENKAVVKVTVRQEKGNKFKASLNGVVSGEFYGPGGTQARLQIIDDKKLQGCRLSASATALMRSDKSENLYVLPDTDVKASIICKVLSWPKPEKISLSCVSKKIAAGKKVALKLSVSPKNAKVPKVNWKVSSARYASVNKKGVVYIKKNSAGKTVTVTAVAADGSALKASAKLKIMKHAVTEVRIKNAPKTLKTGKTISLHTVVKTNGKNANKKIKWGTSDSSFALVDQKGTVTAKKAGKGRTVTITASSTDGSNKKASIKIKIR